MKFKAEVTRLSLADARLRVTELEAALVEARGQSEALDMMNEGLKDERDHLRRELAEARAERDSASRYADSKADLINELKAALAEALQACGAATMALETITGADPWLEAALVEARDVLRLVFDDYPEVGLPGDSFEEWADDLTRRLKDKNRTAPPAEERARPRSYTGPEIAAMTDAELDEET